MNKALQDGSGQWEASSLAAKEAWTKLGEHGVEAWSTAGDIAALAGGVLAL